MSRRAESAPSQEHPELVDALAKYMKGQLGLRLEGVEHDDYPEKSRIINGHKPDVIAYDSAKGLRYIGEAKTPNDITTEHTLEQLRAWKNRVMVDGESKGVNLPILVIVPSASHPELVSALDDWGLTKRVNPLYYGPTPKGVQITP